MALRDIVKDGEPILRMTARRVVSFDQKLCKLLDDMWETMHNAEGCGLAAPQVGILRRVAIVEAEGIKAELINPEITKQEGESVGAEGCLSVPGKSAYVKRPEKIEVTYFDRAGKPQKMTVSGFTARAFCHEIDHLDGIMYYDKKLSEKELQNYEDDDSE